MHATLKLNRELKSLKVQVEELKAQVADIPMLHGIQFNIEGNRMFVINQEGNEIMQYTLAEPWDINGMGFDSAIDLDKCRKGG
jgi:hypothetical protein